MPRHGDPKGRHGHVTKRKIAQLCLSVEEAARALGIGRSLAYELIDSGELHRSASVDAVWFERKTFNGTLLTSCPPLAWCQPGKSPPSKPRRRNLATRLTSCWPALWIQTIPGSACTHLRLPTTHAHRTTRKSDDRQRRRPQNSSSGQVAARSAGGPTASAFGQNDHPS